MDDDLLIFTEDDLPSTDTNNCWNLLIIDDEPEVHSVTRLALDGIDFLGKKLNMVSANSAAQAKEILSGPDKFAMALVDVVMETDHAGLELVRWIREELQDDNIRLVLRTGQPGEAPEREIITDYDINDYKEKTELTANKLYTLTYTCLRAYRDITDLYQNKLGLEAIIQSSNKIFAHQSLADFTQGALLQLCALLHIDAGAMYSNIDCLAAADGEMGSKVLAATGRFVNFLDQPLDKVINELGETKIKELYQAGGQYFGEDYFIGVYDSHLGRNNLLYLQGIKVTNTLDRHLVEIFGNNIGVAFNNQAMFAELVSTQREIVYRISDSIESRSTKITKHGQRMALTCQYLAKALGMSNRQVEMMYKAAPLHDIGKLFVPDDILTKPDKLTNDELAVMQNHAKDGFDLLASPDLELLNVAAIISAEHHENWDGSGYPDGKKGHDIHLYGRIAAVADVFDSLMNSLRYKSAWPLEQTLTFFKEMSGKKFDPQLVELIIEHQDDLMRIQHANQN